MKGRSDHKDIEEIKKYVRDIKGYKYDRKNCINTSMKDLQIIKEIGRGSYGTVYKVLSLIDNRIYALKRIDLTHLKTKHQLSALKEVKILKKLTHPNIIKYYSSFIEKD